MCVCVCGEEECACVGEKKNVCVCMFVSVYVVKRRVLVCVGEKKCGCVCMCAVKRQKELLAAVPTD